MPQIKRLHIFGMIFFISFLEFTVLNRIKVFNVQPDLLLVAVLFFSLRFGRRRSFETGLIAGLCRDIVSGGLLGANTVFFGLFALFVNFMKDKIYKEIFLVQIFVSFIAVIFFYFYEYFVRFVITFSERASFGDGFVSVIVPAAFYTALVSPLVFFALERVYNKA